MTRAGVYLDYNASGLVRPQAAEAVADALARGGNPSSVHQLGRAARRTVEQAREQVAALAGAEPSQIIFTGGGTEANNQAILGAAVSRVIISAIEHDSVHEMAFAGPFETDVVPVNGDGVADAEALARLLTSGDERPTLVSVMLANNETGVIQPVQTIAEVAHSAGALVHCDGVQAAGKIAVDFKDLGVDMLSLSGHKIGGPQGIGALIVRAGLDLAPLLHGGKQERGHRSGTENVPGIAGFGAAAKVARESLGEFTQLAALRDRLESRVRDFAPDAPVHGANGPRLPNTSCLSMPGVSSETQVIAFDLEGIMVSAGAACSSGKVQASGVLTAMGAPEREVESAVRVSLGWASTPADVDRFVAAWSALHERLCSGEATPAAMRSACHG
ncbi:MAG: cysteine desulfurase family protein [Sphingomonadales bacterium]